MPGARASIEQHQPDPMEWEEHDLEYRMASMGLEMDDLFMMEGGGDDETDWLDGVTGCRGMLWDT